jgi:ElaB/YqjD/DUF883 family membrane-anchored ribosome-binding protein
MSTATEALEREVEATRDRVERTVDAIKDKMSVGHILDDVVRYTARHGGSDMAGNLGRQIKENPLPLALVGVGLAWLVFGKGQARDPYDAYAGGYAGEWGESSYRPDMGSKIRGAARGAGSAMHAAASGVSAAAHGIAGAAEKMGEAVGSAVHGLASAGPKMGEMAEGAADDLRHRAHDAAGVAREGMDHAGQYARHAGEYTQRTTRAVGDFLKDEPLLAGAIGVAIGATIGALLPSTEVEDHLFGDTRDRLADEAERLAGEQFEKVKEAAGEAYETVKTEAETRLAEMTGNGEERPAGTF